jgi:hypothetical protein
MKRKSPFGLDRVLDKIFQLFVMIYIEDSWQRRNTLKMMNSKQEFISYQEFF